MVQEDRSRKAYPSDLTNEQWAIVEPLIPPAKQSPRGGRPREVDMREVLNTIFYLNRSGCQWDMLPHDLLPKSTVYPRFKGVWPTDAHFALLSLPDTRRDQSPWPHKRSDAPPGCRGLPG